MALALQEAEPLGSAAEKCARLHRSGIVERAPNPLALPRPDAQAVAIVDFRPPILGLLAVVLRVPEHAGQRRNAHARNIHPREKAGLYIRQRPLLADGLYAEGPCDAGRIEKGIDHDAAFAGRGLEPEARKARKLFRSWHCYVDGKPAGGKSVLARLGRRAEIRGSEEGQPIRLSWRRQNPEAGKSRVGRQRLREAAFAKGEEIGAVENFLGGVLWRHHEKANRLLEIPAKVERLYGIGATAV